MCWRATPLVLAFRVMPATQLSCAVLCGHPAAPCSWCGHDLTPQGDFLQCTQVHRGASRRSPCSSVTEASALPWAVFLCGCTLVCQSPHFQDWWPLSACMCFALGTPPSLNTPALMAVLCSRSSGRERTEVPGVTSCHEACCEEAGTGSVVF